MARRKRHEEHANHERWAIPYGDLITLLLAFFVVMYAISSVNAGKYRVLSDSLVAAFRGGAQDLHPVQGGEKPLGARLDIRLEGAPVKLPEAIAYRSVQPVAVGLQPAASRDPGPQARARAAAEALARVADAVEESLKDLIASKSVIVRRHDTWVEIELRTDILFPSGAAVLSPSAVPAIVALAETLRTVPNPIRVEGHTDNRPISTALYPSNWELSAARAASVVHLLAKHGVDPARLAVLGFAEQRPVAGNDTPEGRNANRRVLLVIQRGDLPEAAPGDAAPASTPPGDAALPAATPASTAAPATAAGENEPRPERVAIAPPAR